MKKAYRYDDEIIFYFDAFDNKFVAKGGSLAWRLNNPGLLLSHSLYRTGYKSIGAYHQYAIFSHPLLGQEALRAWICSTKYYDCPLIEIAKYYQPNRPEQYLDQIRFKQKDYGTEKEFKDAVREVGQEKEGQCIWGFINGLSNSPSQALESASFISKTAQGEHVLYLVNDALRSLPDSIAQKFGHHSESVKFAAQFFKMLIDLSEQTSSQKNKPKIIVFSHSQGALIANLALSRLTVKERQKIHLFTLGGAVLIEPDAAHPKSHNYFSLPDLISKLTSYTFCTFLLRLHDGKKAGLKPEQVIEQLILEDIEMRLETRDPKAIAKFRKQREEHYAHELWKSQNITILNDESKKIFEHALKSPCYRQQVIEIIDEYRR